MTFAGPSLQEGHTEMIKTKVTMTTMSGTDVAMVMTTNEAHPRTRMNRQPKWPRQRLATTRKTRNCLMTWRKYLSESSLSVLTIIIQPIVESSVQCNRLSSICVGRELFGTEDQDYRQLNTSGDRLSEGMVSPGGHSAGWARFKASRPEEFPFSQPRTSKDIDMRSPPADLLSPTFPR